MDFADGRLSAAMERRVQGHLDGCPPCLELAREFGRLVESLIQEGVNTPPAALSRWARSLPDQWPAPRLPGVGARVAAAATAGLRGVRAGLMRVVADSWSLLAGSRAEDDPSGVPLAGAVRSPLSPRGSESTLAGRRRLLLAAPPFDLDLQIDYRGSADPRGLRGQILPLTGTRREWQGSEVCILTGRRTLARTRIDRRGEFDFSNIPPGRYRIAIASGTAARAPRSTSPLIEV